MDASVPVPSGTKVPDNRVRVLLPEGYEANACGRWPVLYLLHGVGDMWESWSARTDVVELTRQLPLIVVMPDGGNTPDAGWYSDWVDGSRQWESFHTRVLIPWVDATFRTLAEGHRMVAGFSMGGFGAMSYAARHPGLFAAAASFSGIVDTMYGYPASGAVFDTARSYLGTPDDRVWGNQVQDEATWREHNPTDLAADLKGTALFVYSGMGSPGGQGGDNPQKPPNYAVENVIFQTNLSLTRALDAAGVPYRSDFHAGYHDWPYFQAGLHWALPQMMPTVAGNANANARCTTPAIAREPDRRTDALGGSQNLPATGAGRSTAGAAAVLAAAFALLRFAAIRVSRPRARRQAPSR